MKTSLKASLQLQFLRNVHQASNSRTQRPWLLLEMAGEHMNTWRAVCAGCRCPCALAGGAASVFPPLQHRGAHVYKAYLCQLPEALLMPASYDISVASNCTLVHG